MHRGKGMKFVGDSRVSAVKKNHIKPKDYSEYPGRTEAFWPDFLLKEWMVGAVFLVGFLILTVAHPSPLQSPADPTDASYIALPDWYFLFLYQLLKYPYASGDFNIVGAIIIPGLAFSALLLMPFIDTTPERRPSKRPVATSIMLLVFASMIFLTWESVDAVNWDQVRNQGQITDADLGLLPDVEVDKESDGYLLYSGPQGQACISCHGDDLLGGAGPILLGNTLTTEEIIEIVKDGRGSMPGEQFKGTDEELATLAEWIASLKEEE
jgi:menaquinol-cytochrome c reductase cytochrome b/c subunit